MPEDKKSTVENLIRNAAFMNETLKDLQQQINDGYFSDERTITEVLKSYNTTVKVYSGMIRQLLQLLPDRKEKQTGELKDFLRECGIDG